MKIRVLKGNNVFEKGDILDVIYVKKGLDSFAIYKEDAEVVPEVENKCITCNFHKLYKENKNCGAEFDNNFKCKKWQPIEQAEGKIRKSDAIDAFAYSIRIYPARVGQDVTIITNSQGGKQSKIDTAFSLVPHDALLAVARVMKEGSKRYEKDNWRKLSADEIYDHLMEHLVNWHMTGSKEDLEHAVARAMMLYSVAEGK